MRRDRFDLPDDIVYLDGNSLGPLPTAATERISRCATDEWGAMLIRGWNEAGWMTLPSRLGDRIGALIGCPPGSVVTGDTLSIKVFQALSAALQMRPDRPVVLSDRGNFPTDLYITGGLLASLGRGHELRLVDPDAVADALDDDVAALLLTHVDYRTGRMHDLDALTAAAHEVGAVVIWDLAHSAGAIDVDIGASGAEFAVGCTYKYLNGGPGAPAFIAVRPDLADSVAPSLAGWLGHEAPFAFDLDYRPAPGVERFRVGTPPVLQMVALDAALDVWDGVSMAEVRARSIELTEAFVAGVEERCPDLTLASPRDPERRGSQVSFAFEHGYAAMQALIDRGVIGDFRAPDIMRFGFAPLYVDLADVERAVDVIADVMATGAWRDPRFRQRAAVT